MVSYYPVWRGTAVKVAVLGLVLAALSCRMSGGASHDDAFTDKGLITAEAGRLAATKVSPHLDAPIASRESVIWCSTFQMAWNELSDLVGGDVHFSGEPPMVAAMNRREVTKADLDEASYVAMAGFIRDGIVERIRDALQAKFHGAATPRLLGSLPASRPQDILAYAYLFKNLQFAVPFEDIPGGMRFEGIEVAAFGRERGKAPTRGMLEQVLVHDYKDPDDFVIELKSKSHGDRIVLAKVQPGATLSATVDAVTARLSAQPRPADAPPHLIVPKLNFDVVRRYDEIVGKRLVTDNPDIAKDLYVLEAMQDIRFQMDEKGVRLRSEANMSIGCAVSAPRVTPMVFDKPFLIMLTRSDARRPYFAMWVANAELLVKR